MSESEPPELRQVFDEMEAGFEAGLRREAEQEAVAALRAQVGETRLWEALARCVGMEVAVRAETRLLRGTLLAGYPDFFVLRSDDGGQHLVPIGPAATVTLPVARSAPRPVPVASRYRLALALRELARRREPVRLQLAGGGTAAGTIELVGRDYLELAEHNPGEARRESALTGRRLLGLASVAVVSLLPDCR